MNHTFVTYLGFVVAVLIITWAAVVLVRRYQRAVRPNRPRQSQTGATAMDQWITLRPGSKQPIIEQVVDDEEIGDAGSTLPDADPHTRARQNGHSQNGHSQTKYPL